MKVAIATHDGWVSPVFDVAGRLLLVEIEAGQELSRLEAALTAAGPLARARHVAEMGVDELICGAISRPLEQMLLSAGVRVIPQTCGPVDEVLSAFAAGQLTEQAFLMPGCCGQRRRMRRGRRRRAGFRGAGETR